MRTRKKPIESEAWPVRELIHAAEHDWNGLPAAVVRNYERGDVVFQPRSINLRTIEGNWVRADEDGMVLVDSRGYLYPCDARVFEDTYDVLEDQTAAEAATGG